MSEDKKTEKNLPLPPACGQEEGKTIMQDKTRKNMYSLA
jgi:hypothetical protein